MRIFKNLWFSRFAAKEGISDDDLKALVSRLEAGQIDADLGGGVYKQRAARPGAGKSGGYRVMVYYRKADKLFFQYGFAKSARDNISRQELQIHKETAKALLSLDNKQLENLLEKGTYTEI